MGKIIRNGVEFSGTLDNAANVNYNNELSGMEATTVQEAIDEVCGSLTNENVWNTTPVFQSQVSVDYTYIATEDCLVVYQLYSYGEISRFLVNGIVRAVVGGGTATTNQRMNANSIVLHKGDTISFTASTTDASKYAIYVGIYVK